MTNNREKYFAPLFHYYRGVVSIFLIHDFKPLTVRDTFHHLFTRKGVVTQIFLHDFVLNSFAMRFALLTNLKQAGFLGIYVREEIGLIGTFESL